MTRQEIKIISDYETDKYRTLRIMQNWDKEHPDDANTEATRTVFNEWASIYRLMVKLGLKQR